MKRALLCSLLALGCATAPTPKPDEKPTAAAATLPEAVCPKAGALPRTTSDDPSALWGQRIDKVCLVGATEDGFLKFNELVAPAEGQTLTAELVSRYLEQLVLPSTLQDAAAFAQPVASGGVMLTWVVAEFPRLGKVTFTGTKAVSEDLLRDLALRAARANRYELSRVANNMATLYTERGFSKVKVEPKLSDAVNGQADVTFAVEEGPRTLLTAIRFVGNKRVSEAELKKVLKSTTSAPFLKDLAEVDALSLSAAYYDRGMVNVTVTSETKQGATVEALELIFTIKEGDVFKMGALKLTGHSLGDEKKLLKGLEAKPGQVFSRAVLKRDMDRLKVQAEKQGLNINVTPLTDVDIDKKRIDVTLEVEKLSAPIRF